MPKVETIILRKTISQLLNTSLFINSNFQISSQKEEKERRKMYQNEGFSKNSSNKLLLSETQRRSVDY